MNLKNHFSHIFLEENTDALINNSEQTVDEILKRNFDDNDLTVSLLRSLFNYEAVFDSFCSFIFTAYEAVKQLHAEHLDEIQNLNEKYSTKKFIEKVATLDFVNPSPTSVKDKISICLLNQLVVINKGNPETGNYFILGKRCEDFIGIHRNYCNIDPRLLCEALGHPIKFAILRKLKEQEFTATQLSEILFVSRQAINAHLLWMLKYMFIEISRRNKAEIYYRVNQEFFQSTKDVLFKLGYEFAK